MAQESIDKYEKGKDELRRQQSLVRWRKDNGQWSSVAEPLLSPIAQSRSSSPQTETEKNPAEHRSSKVQASTLPQRERMSNQEQEIEKTSNEHQHAESALAAAIQGKPNKPGSASIPTITITGSATSLPLADAGASKSKQGTGFDGAIAESQWPHPQHEALFSVFPPECETEQLVEQKRPPSRNSHDRYYIVQTPSGGDEDAR
ncbi:hypothetical protein Sste5346_007662 [Sporothrix stenoceras]|uniref:Uncharacterized protein n=1 Tax=Sporothrix stenoceras TaxID=5173 RepID=A0ABR3YST3_9PEZI